MTGKADADGPDEGDAHEEEHEEEPYQRLERRLESVGVLRASRPMHGAAERSMLRTLAGRATPLADIDGFAAAHRDLARALETMMVNAQSAPTLPRALGPTRPLLQPVVQFVANIIQNGQITKVMRDVARLYAVREANAVWGTPEHVVLRRSRVQMQVLTEVSGKSLSLPVFLLSGAFLSGILSVLQALVAPARDSKLIGALLLLLAGLLLLLVGGGVLLGASVAKMRLRLALQVPLESVYDAIGSTGPTPRDTCFEVALAALALLALAVVAIPGGVFWLLR